MEKIGMLLMGLVFVVACSSGGSSSEEVVTQQTESFELVRGDVPSERQVTLTNPFDEEVVVERLSAPGSGFVVTGLFFPIVMLPLGTRDMTVSFTPGEELTATSSMRVRFLGSDRAQSVNISFDATVEVPATELLTDAADFGDVLVGDSRSMDVQVRNLSVVTPVRVSLEGALAEDFRVSGAPTTIPPGATINVALTFKPTSFGPRTFDLLIKSASGEPTFVTSVSADSTDWAPVMIIEFPSVAVVDGETAWVEVDVPPTAISVHLEAAAPNTVLGLLAFEGPGGLVYENDQGTGPLRTFPAFDLFTATVPASDRMNLRPVPGGGIYRFRFFQYGSAARMSVRVIINNRPNAQSIDGVLDVNVFVSPGTGLTGESAPGDARLGEILTEMDRILQQQGIRLGAISYYSLPSSSYDWIRDDEELGDVLEETSVALDVRLNLLFVTDVFVGGVLGVSARLGGPMRNGSRTSGVLMDFDYGTSDDGAATTAHEAGHFLGLFHTTEQNGLFDFIDDTEECPPTGTSATCPTVGNDNLMHWSAFDASPILTNGQGLVLRGHPLVSPVPGGGPSLASRPSPTAGASGRSGPLVLTLPPGWCGTKGCAENRK